MDKTTYNDDLAFYLLNKGPHIASYNPDKARDFVENHSEELFLLYYLFYRANLALNMINRLYDAGMLEGILSGYRHTIEKLKASFSDVDNLVKYSKFIDEVIDSKYDSECPEQMLIEGFEERPKINNL